MEWQVSRSLANVERAVIVFVLRRERHPRLQPYHD